MTRYIFSSTRDPTIKICLFLIKKINKINLNNISASIKKKNQKEIFSPTPFWIKNIVFLIDKKNVEL